MQTWCKRYDAHAVVVKGSPIPIQVLPRHAYVDVTGPVDENSLDLGAQDEDHHVNSIPGRTLASMASESSVSDDKKRVPVYYGRPHSTLC